MRYVLFALTLLYAVAGSASIVISDEVVSDPLTHHRLPAFSFAAPAVSMAKDQSGVAIAWSMPNAVGVERVYVARLDAAGHVAGAVREEPAASSLLYDAVAPSIAANPSGSGFTLAWMELSSVVYCRLDANLAPSAPVTMNSTDTAPLVRSGRNSKSVWIAGGGQVREVTADGTTASYSAVVASDMTVGTDFPQLVGGRTIKTFVSCTCGGSTHFAPCPEQCKVYQTSYAIDYTAIFTASQSREFPFASDAQPAVASDARDLMMAWFDGPQAAGGSVMAARFPLSALTRFATTPPLRLGSVGPDAGATRPDIASDGEHFVVVWRVQTPQGDHDVAGALVDRDGNVTPLSIAASAADERDPSVIALGNGAFLVAYEKLIGGERRIAGRFVTFGRARAVR